MLASQARANNSLEQTNVFCKISSTSLHLVLTLALQFKQGYKAFTINNRVRMSHSYSINITTIMFGYRELIWSINSSRQRVDTMPLLGQSSELNANITINSKHDFMYAMYVYLCL